VEGHGVGCWQSSTDRLVWHSSYGQCFYCQSLIEVPLPFDFVIFFPLVVELMLVLNQITNEKFV
jgi:hypothetical protein